MGIKRIVDTAFWGDEKVLEEFTPEDRLFMLYLMTSPHSTQLGVYKLVPIQAAFELGFIESSPNGERIGYDSSKISELLERFVSKFNMIRYSEKTHEVAIKNYLNYSIVKGGKPVLELLKKEAGAVQDKSLLSFIDTSKSSNQTVKEFAEFLATFLNLNENEKENDNDNDNEESSPVTPRIVNESSTIRQSNENEKTEESSSGNSLDWFFESYEERLGRDLSDDEKNELRVFATTQKMPKSQDLVNLILKTRGD